MEFTIESDRTLNGTIFIPSSEPKSVVIINPATAANTSYYYPFAEYLKGHGHVVVTWNYHGYGESKTSSLKNSEIKFSDTGLIDMPTLLDYISKKYPKLPITGIGHSVGGQQIGLVKNNNLLNGYLAVGSAGGYSGYMPIGYRLQTFFFFNIFSPISNLFFGYIRAKKFNIMEDLPPLAYKEWKQWCKEKDYLFSEKYFGKSIPKGNYDSIPFPIHVIYASDDPIATESSIQRLWKHFKSNHAITYKSYSPSEVGNLKIEHFGYFKKKFKDNIWKDMLSKIEEFNQKNEHHQ